MKVLHLMAKGGMGGIETLAREYSYGSKNENVYVFVWDGGYNAEMIEKNGCKSYYLNCGKMNNIRTILKLKKVVNIEKPDIIVSQHNTPITRYFCFLMKKIKKIKICTYLHANAHDHLLQNNNIKSILSNDMLKRRVESSDIIIAISNSVKKSALEVFNVEKERIVTIYNGVNLSKFEERDKRQNDILNLIFVGRLVKVKGVQNIIEALAICEKSYKYHLSIVGDGPYRKELEKLVKEKGLELNVSFLGARTDVNQLLNKSDVFIHMPEWEEGFGITIVEAMAAGNVCLAAKCGAIPEIIDDEVDGYLIEKGNITELARKIQMVGQNKNIENIRMNARKKALSFSIEKYINELDELLS